jgi:uncharacterized membrane protein
LPAPTFRLGHGETEGWTRMARQSPNWGIGGRTQQAGTLVAATFLPITFQRTLMPRSALDQALVTGISTSLNYAMAALIQDSIEALALRGAGRTDPATVDRDTWRRTSIGLDLAAIGLGLAVQRVLRPRSGERLTRGGYGRPPGGSRRPGCRAPSSAGCRS